MTLVANASADAKISKSMINIKYLSQKIAKNYLYLYYVPNKSSLKIELKNDIKLLENDFRFVAKSTNSSDTKDILNFLSYTKDQIKDLLKDSITFDNSVLMLDHSEAIYEGAESVLSTMQRDSKKQEIKVYVMRVLKTYMAVNTGKNAPINKEQLLQEVSFVESKLTNVLNTNGSWKAFKNLIDSKNGYIPSVASVLIKDIENRVE
jgi:hypothetical protein